MLSDASIFTKDVLLQLIQAARIHLKATDADLIQRLDGGDIKLGDLMSHLPQQSDAFYQKAIRQDPHALRNIKNQTPELCELAVSLDPTAATHVKDPSLQSQLIAKHPLPESTTLGNIPFYPQQWTSTGSGSVTITPISSSAIPDNQPIDLEKTIWNFFTRLNEHSALLRRLCEEKEPKNGAQQDDVGSG